MTPPPGVKEVSAGYGELALVEQPAIDLLTSAGLELQEPVRRDLRRSWAARGARANPRSS